MRGDPGGGRVRSARQDPRLPAEHHLSRHHDAAPRRLPDVLGHQAQPEVRRHARDHALGAGRDLRPGARKGRRRGRVPHEAIHQGKPPGRGAQALPRNPGHQRRDRMTITRVLVVDDSATERYTLSEMLTKAGYSPLQAENGEDAIRKAKEAKPDLVLMDIVMPGLNGFQVTRALTEDAATKHIPVIICTTKGQETDKLWGLRQGAKDYLVKPVQSKELVQKIKALG